MITDDLNMRDNTNATHIEKEFVHKSFNENVFVSRIDKISEKVFKVQGLLPKTHTFYNDQLCGLSACPFFIELSRQSNMAICHLFFNIRLDSVFTMTSVDWLFTDNQPFLPRNFDPIMYDVEFAKYKVRKQFTFIKIIGHLYQKGYNFLNGESTFLFSHEEIDNASEGIKSAPFQIKKSIANPECIQVKNTENVLIAPPEYDKTSDTIKTQMIPNTRHSYFYEHPCAHVPGMMILEAGKQAAIAGLKTRFDFLRDTYGDLKEGRIAFSNFATPCQEISIEIKFREPAIHSDFVHIPISVFYLQNEQKLGTIESVASFMDKKEALLKSIYVPVS